MRPVPACIGKIKTMADQSIRLEVDTQELPAETMSELFALRGGIGYFMFAEQPKSEMDLTNVPEIKIERGEKTKGQRLRATLYVLWGQTKTDSSFEEYYNVQMEKIIDAVKMKLE